MRNTLLLLSLAAGLALVLGSLALLVRARFRLARWL